MLQFPNILLVVALAAVTLVLFAGIANMIRGGNPSKSQTLMRWRVGLQFLALLIVMGILYFRH
jgi:hypothetical protein